ncbi:MAG: hypothetical protein ACYDH9_17380 [Limisphaerales bacterium]
MDTTGQPEDNYMQPIKQTIGARKGACLCGAVSFLFALMVAGATACASPAGAAVQRLWQPVPDNVYLQETGRKVTASAPLTSVAVYEGIVYAGSAKGLHQLKGNELVEVSELREPVNRLVTAGGALWAITSPGLHRFQNGAWKKISGEVVSDVCEHLGAVVAAGGSRLWRVKGDALEPLTASPSPFEITRVVSYGETLYVHGPGRLTIFDGTRFGARNVWNWPVEKVWDWGELPSLNTRDVLSLGSRLYIATDRGLGVLRGMSLTELRGEQGLCYEDTTCLARGFGGDLWIGTTRGAIRHTGGQFHYFAGQRWLPDDRVNAMASSDHAVFIATDQGLGLIEYEPYTLLKKAAYYERHLEEWGQKRLGLVHVLGWDDKLKEFVREISDNDGGYSCDYLAAQAYRYAVTKDPEARREAVNTFHTIRWLEAMTGIKGFPARAVWAKNERGHQAQHGSGEAAAEWHDTKDGLFEWKGDTSSDELCAHFYAIAIFLELAAQGEEIQQAKTFLSRVAGHLMDHGWRLIDLDGKPTRWGHWNPEYFNSAGEGNAARGLNALEILSMIKTAAVLTGEPRFAQGYQELVKLGYPEYTLRQKCTFPPGDVLQFLDRLSFFCYPSLLKYETDPKLRSLYRRSFERTWEIQRIEQATWFNFIYGALTGNDCEVEPAVAHLREWPLDLVLYSFQNSQRADRQTPPGYVAYSGGTRAFSPREREPMLWDNWTMGADGGAGGHAVMQPSAWLMAYWMGRYHGFIEAPRATDPALLTVERHRGLVLGAKPYAGPPRPSGF